MIPEACMTYNPTLIQSKTLACLILLQEPSSSHHLLHITSAFSLILQNMLNLNLDWKQSYEGIWEGRGRHLERGRRSLWSQEFYREENTWKMNVSCPNLLIYSSLAITEIPFSLNVFILPLIIKSMLNWLYLIKHSSSYLISMNICPLTRLTDNVIPSFWT